jgi:hypothetical protein
VEQYASILDCCSNRHPLVEIADPRSSSSSIIAEANLAAPNLHCCCDEFRGRENKAPDVSAMGRRLPQPTVPVQWRHALIVGYLNVRDLDPAIACTASFPLCLAESKEDRSQYAAMIECFYRDQWGRLDTVPRERKRIVAADERDAIKEAPRVSIQLEPAYFELRTTARKSRVIYTSRVRAQDA